MPKTNVKRTVQISASAAEVYKVVSNLNFWQAWSPWLIMEPECKVTVREDNKYYEWKGKRIGSGNMLITSEKQNESVTMDLVFLKPWKSQSKVRFELRQKDEATELAWYMEGSLPFFMFWMKTMMENFVGMDFDRGLTMLKEYVEEGEVHSKLEFKGSSDFAHTKYVGIKSTCSMKELGEKMSQDFGKLGEWMAQNAGLSDGKMFSLYHKWDMAKGSAVYTAALGVSRIPDSLPTGFVKGEIPATKITTVRHIGPYHHLGNAWSTAFSMHRGKEFKPKKSIPPFELYINSPMEVESKALITDINFAVNG
uniref:SRPBCC family protein n=1 Tax=Roseivirga sp. TaxID=1964215 RepID=UPI0040474C21